jgi:hypothetical protein
MTDGPKEFMSGEEASEISGFSLLTLQRFVELGYISVREEPSGLSLFNRNEIRSLFQECGESNELSAFDSIPTESAHVVTGNDEEGRSGSHNSTPIELLTESLASALSEKNLPPSQEFSKSPSVDVTRVTPNLKDIIEIIRVSEKVLQAKEREVQELKEERTWLRRRVEKLEEQGDRDKILLLTGSQTVQRLLETPPRSVSPLKAALRYLGLSSEKKE